MATSRSLSCGCLLVPLPGLDAIIVGWEQRGKRWDAMQVVMQSQRATTPPAGFASQPDGTRGSAVSTAEPSDPWNLTAKKAPNDEARGLGKNQDCAGAAAMEAGALEHGTLIN